ncbi:MAG: glycerate kinase [Oscillospiraceae bacterium]|nr:glycerate kinase [Oscillospiraceae bacterium]
MKKCVVVSDSFKGTVSSREICEIAQRVIPRHFPACEVVCIPVADGGEGTVDCFVQAMGAQRVEITVTNALGEKSAAAYARLGELAIIEMAAAAGLPQVGALRCPGTATTYGVGELIAHAVDSGCRKILLGLGGSATNDGGCGCAAALGVRFYDADGQSFVPVGDTLGRIARIDTAEAEALLRSVEITVMCDVTNPLYGPTGAAYVFAPQKGADAEKVKSLDAGLRHFGDVIRSQYGLDVSAMPGAGAAGGMGAGCVALLGGTIQSGIDAVLDVTGFDRQLEGADLVITGEGRIDSQSADGKVVSGVARRTRAKGVPLIAIAGGIADSAGAVYDIGVSAMFSTDRAALPVDMLGARSPSDYEATLSDIMSLIAIAERFA